MNDAKRFDELRRKVADVKKLLKGPMTYGDTLRKAFDGAYLEQLEILDGFALAFMEATNLPPDLMEMVQETRFEDGKMVIVTSFRRKREENRVIERGT